MVKAKNNKLANNVRKKGSSKEVKPSKTSKKPDIKVEVEGLDEETQMENDTNMLIYEKKESDEVVAEPAKKKLSRKERIRLEKIVEKKEKSSRRAELLEKLSAFQVNRSELNMYSSVKSIGQKEKKSQQEVAVIDDGHGVKMAVNSIAGGNRKKRKLQGKESEESEQSVDTDDMSSDSEIDDGCIQRALDNYKRQSEELRIASLNLARLEKRSKAKEERNDARKDVLSDGEGVEATGTGTSRPTKYVHVDRREDIKESRSKLPIITEEQVIMEKIAENDIVIICGETGSGKTTQVPQFLYEAGYASDDQIIGITEPRRVAAIAMSKRVNDEMNFNESDQIVSFQIRYEGNYSPNTKLKFMTDGVLLKEVQTDFLLSKYSALIIDEAHERSVYTDILIGLLSRIVPLRSKRGNPLKLIIMSATLRVQDFTENRRLFKSVPPQIRVEARQFDVAVHFNKHTHEDYLSEAYKKVCKIHERLPEGGVLVFVTGQQEVNVLCAKLRRTYPNTPAADGGQENEGKGEIGSDGPDFSGLKSRKKRRAKKSNEVKEICIKDAPKVSLDSYSTIPLGDQLEMDLTDGEDEELDHQFNLDENSDDDDEDLDDELKPTKLGAASGGNKPLYVLPLYSLLSSEKQQRVFDQVPANCRLCVVATNVAETSLTIPNIKYVVDCGKIKMKFYDKITGVSAFRICWTSKASAEQRAGRAGRTAPGHCYRLFSSAVFNDEFPQFAEPEIVRKPVEDLILQMKDLGIDRIVNFPFPTPPDDAAIRVAEKLLVQLGALELDKTRPKPARSPSEQVTRITGLGKLIASFPINPRYGKMLTLASQQEDRSILSYVICMISGLSVAELFIDGETVIEQKTTEDIQSRDV